MSWDDPDTTTRTIVVQYEKHPGKETIVHIAIMASGAMQGHSYSRSGEHETVASYLCTRTPPPYHGWDMFTAATIQRNIAEGRILCPTCFDREETRT